jgi:predicted polyphosphate/ATP-dependent NAD kinase
MVFSLNELIFVATLRGGLRMACNRLGLIVNPIAGMGGRVGLKGTDGEEILRICREKGAVPEAPKKAVEALKRLLPAKDEIEIVTYPGEMGELEVREAGFEPIVIGSIIPGNTTSEDTRRAAKDIADFGVKLLLFAGGDGTARDVYLALKDRQQPVLGIPAGVKIHSGVFAINPRRAGELALLFMQGKVRDMKEAEVMDIDEEAFRQGWVSAALYGYLLIPHERTFVQSKKAGQAASDTVDLEGISYYILDHMDENKDAIYIIGPGTTTRAIKQKLGDEYTLLGVDVSQDKKIIALDADEKKLLEILSDAKKAFIVVTIIGGQGYIFGRGNQQISPKVIRKVGLENIIVVATRNKVSALGHNPLLVDTGDEELDQALCGYVRVVTGYLEQRIMKVSV